jgi:hypothetical protein
LSRLSKAMNIAGRPSDDCLRTGNPSDSSNSDATAVLNCSSNGRDGGLGPASAGRVKDDTLSAQKGAR